MDKRCGTCLYEDFDTDAIPCKDCSNCNMYSKDFHWTPKLEDVTDLGDRLNVLLKSLNIITFEIARLRNTLDDLVETVKERNKE